MTVGFVRALAARSAVLDSSVSRRVATRRELCGALLRERCALVHSLLSASEIRSFRSTIEEQTTIKEALGSNDTVVCRLPLAFPGSSNGTKPT